MSDEQDAHVTYHTLEELLPDPRSRERFEQTSASLEAAAVVRMLRRQALSADGTRGITQAELAQRVGLTPARISQIEKGEGSNGPTYAVIRKIAHACGVEWARVIRRALAGVAKTPQSTAGEPEGYREATLVGSTVLRDFGAGLVVGTIQDVLSDQDGNPRLALIESGTMRDYQDLSDLTYDDRSGAYVLKASAQAMVGHPAGAMSGKLPVVSIGPSVRIASGRIGAIAGRGSRTESE